MLSLVSSPVYIDSITANLNETIDRPLEKPIRISTTSKFIASEETNKFYVTLTGLTSDCVVTASANIEVPSNFLYNFEYSASNTLVIKVKNDSAASMTLPAIILNISYRHTV